MCKGEAVKRCLGKVEKVEHVKVTLKVDRRVLVCDGVRDGYRYGTKRSVQKALS